MRLMSSPCSESRHPTCSGADCPCSCHVETQLRQDAVAHGERAGITGILTADLWAHLRSGLQSLTAYQATKVVKHLIDLGWRPVPPTDSKEAV